MAGVNDCLVDHSDQDARRAQLCRWSCLQNVGQLGVIVTGYNAARPISNPFDFCHWGAWVKYNGRMELLIIEGFLCTIARTYLAR